MESKSHFFLVLLIFLSSFKLYTSIDQTFILNTTYGECEVSICGSVFCATTADTKCENSNCICGSGYMSTLKDSRLIRCCYEQKNSLTAFLLEFFIGFGAGHFYYGSTTYGIIKLCFYLLFLSIVLFLLIKAFIDKRNKNKKENTHVFRIFRIVSFVLIGFTYICWQMIDSVMIVLGGYTDSNGFELY